MLGNLIDALIMEFNRVLDERDQVLASASSEVLERASVRCAEAAIAAAAKEVAG